MQRKLSNSAVPHLHKLGEVCQAGVQLRQRGAKVVALHGDVAQQAVHICWG